MVNAQAWSAWDYSGMHSIVLKHRGKPVCAAIIRVFGRHLAEVRGIC